MEKQLVFVDFSEVIEMGKEYVSEFNKWHNMSEQEDDFADKEAVKVAAQIDALGYVASRVFDMQYDEFMALIH